MQITEDALRMTHHGDGITRLVMLTAKQAD